MEVKPSDDCVVISINNDDATANNKNGKFTTLVETDRYVELLQGHPAFSHCSHLLLKCRLATNSHWLKVQHKVVKITYMHLQ